MGGCSHRHQSVDDRLSIADTSVANSFTPNDTAIDAAAHSKPHRPRERHLDRQWIRLVQR
jgi:hypothetical protein